ncbi:MULTISPECIES: hypothetical protein [unclassified Vibrio]|uniref:hypothetical protein n=1 Tax=unclassified Vibrio TaxID=2614977 RepID=UPI000B8EBF65|nr:MULTISPECIES: hypothetical protein [unclassified Vibrio]NAW91687.1 hypothetical protein [Vibrio sp. V24_P1S3T111]OXX19135.1 hypothetical protein B9J86_16145 [Vibrio sp. V06_P1A73T115]OXX20471.1 hypothetical protein B9J88_13810 [Vibrio sp. V05_P4A8T149]OXX36291.1 hypothetical protein B9J81_06355 [Vibrio sp. V04_P4A5T148]OXX55110.1 hypothetical protein B9J91_10165 [Vibrio sp. V18_P1S4T112]
MAIRMNVQSQIELLQKIKRLSDAGVLQKGIADQISKYGNKKEKLAAESCKISLGSGFSMAHGLKDYLSKNAYLSLLSNEKLGEFNAGLQDAIDSLKIENASTTQLVKVFRKPILSLIIVFLASALTSKFAFPSLAELVSRRRWGTVSVLANEFGLFWLNYGLVISVIFFIVFISMFISLKYWCGDSRKYVDNLPVYKQYRYIQCANLLTSIAHQVSIGTNIKQALLQYQEECGKYVSLHIDKMFDIMGTGKTNLGDIFDTGLLVDEEVDTLKLLGDIGDFSKTLKRSSIIHQEKLTDEINKLKTWGVRITNVVTYSFGCLVLSGVMLLAFDSITKVKFGY